MKKGTIAFLTILLVVMVFGLVRMNFKEPVEAEGFEEVTEEQTEANQEATEEAEETAAIEEAEENQEAEADQAEEVEIDEAETNGEESVEAVADNNQEVEENHKEEENIVNVEDPEDILVLVNKERQLPSDYVPSDLVIPNVSFSFSEDLPKKYMRKVAAEALEELFDEAEKDAIELFAVSGYRSYSRQKSIFEANVRRKGEKEANKTSAFPGQSEHQTGLAMDVSSRSVALRLTEELGNVKEGIWLKENAHRFGFIIRYPKGKETTTGYTYEPWHLRYVGKEEAEAIYSSDITLEEYLGFEYSRRDIY
ncbi:M15 family metallopeptidase [Alkaliphilus pronyensis]|uniref:M15 family metallopeptidase n=1 Tax=Alkaliphilus pronyensis TaxID=1482732 RepID=A0A6I0FB97_9FIRM|nr:M15 family metallopeptidase [Alkaliphilus pronyensis]KAB3536043.1 M15 family metallopeptidase [Alkaliphilus pronyensis]